MGGVRGGKLIAGAAFAAIALACCSRPDAGGTLPAVPSLPRQTGGPDQPPVVWIAGTIDEVAADRIELREGSGSVVTLQRLGREATGIFRVSEEAWERLPPGAAVAAGERACVETLMDGQTLLALRVFLGAGCGPA